MSINKQTLKNAAAGAGVVLFFLLALAFGLSGDGPAKVMQFIKDSSVFFIHANIILLMALVLLYVSQFIVNREWYDKFGAAIEMCKIFKRVDVEGVEKPYDGIATGLAYLGNRLLMALFYLTLFMMHQ